MKGRETGRPCLISWPFKAQIIKRAAFDDFVSFEASFFQPKAFYNGSVGTSAGLLIICLLLVYSK